MAEWLEQSPLVLKVPDLKHSMRMDFSITLSVHQSVNGYLTLFRFGEGENCEEEDWRPTSATSLLV